MALTHETVWQRTANNQTSQKLQDASSKLKLTPGARCHRVPLVSTCSDSASLRAQGVPAPLLSPVWNVWNIKPGHTDSATGKRPALLPWSWGEGAVAGKAGVQGSRPVAEAGALSPTADPLGAGSAPHGTCQQSPDSKTVWGTIASVMKE